MNDKQVKMMVMEQWVLILLRRGGAMTLGELVTATEADRVKFSQQQILRALRRLYARGDVLKAEVKGPRGGARWEASRS